MIGYAAFTPESDVFAWSAPDTLPPSIANTDEATFCLVRCSEQPLLDRTKTVGEDANTKCLLVEPQGSGSSLIAIVPAVTPPVILRLFDARQSKRIRDVTFPSCVRAVRLNMKRLVVMLEDQVQIFDAETLRNLHRFDAPRQSSADCCALSSNCILSLAAARTGSVLLFDAMNLRVIQVVAAHQTPLSCLALSENGQLLATASETGTLVRLFSVATGEKLCVFRRGSKSCRVRCLRFSMSSISAGMFLAVGSDNGTVHVFRIPSQFTRSHGSFTSTTISNQPNDGGFAASATSQITTFFSNLLPTSVSDIVEPSRCLCLARTFSSPLACCFAPGPSGSSPQTVLVRVVTTDGLFREYVMDTAHINHELPLRRHVRLLSSAEAAEEASPTGNNQAQVATKSGNDDEDSNVDEHENGGKASGEDSETEDQSRRSLNVSGNGKISTSNGRGNNNNIGKGKTKKKSHRTARYEEDDDYQSDS